MRRSNVTRSGGGPILGERSKPPIVRTIRLAGGALSRLASPDIGAANLAVDARRFLGRVDLEFDVFKARVDQSGPVFVDRDRARDASRPGVQRLLDPRLEGPELDHV